MFTHISIGITDIKRSLPLYDVLMQTLGHDRYFGSEKEEFMAYGPEDCFFIINTPEDPTRGQVKGSNGSHICFKAETKEQVDTFHKKAIDLGCTDGGKPGLRPEYKENYYAAFIIDYDGNKLETVTYL